LRIILLTAQNHLNWVIFTGMRYILSPKRFKWDGFGEENTTKIALRVDVARLKG